MKLITIRSQIQGVAKAWHAQYLAKPGSSFGGNKEAVYAGLVALDLNACSAEDVAAVIGNSSWACQRRCDECDVYCDTVIRVGQEPDYESVTACLCMACCKKALEMFP